MKPRHRRVTISLPEDLLEEIDRCARILRETRSAVMAARLRDQAEQTEKAAIDQQIERYYLRRSAAADREEQRMLRAAARSFSAGERPRRRATKK